jgi:hypothetical protein
VTCRWNNYGLTHQTHHNRHTRPFISRASVPLPWKSLISETRKSFCIDKVKKTMLPKDTIEHPALYQSHFQQLTDYTSCYLQSTIFAVYNIEIVMYAICLSSYWLPNRLPKEAFGYFVLSL